tara:strand:+ start:676 stop:1146 length:471 start_codon:yes stop_codon:yes gene_type:complete
MKQIIAVIISLTFLICQDTLKTTDGKEYVGKLVSNSKSTVVFLVEDGGIQKALPVSIIANLTLEDGTVLISNNKSLMGNRGIGSQPFNIRLKSIGGFLIGFSGIMLYSINQMELDNDATLDDFEDFVDKVESRSDMAYIALAVGGIMIALDELKDE